MNNKDTGLLLNGEDIKLHRQWFTEMTELIGIVARYRFPIEERKTYDLYGELEATYSSETPVGIIFEEHPNQHTMRKLGWVSELDENMSIIHVPYDLPHLQKGCLFTIPAGIDDAEPRVFRVEKLSTIGVYPASVTCEIGPMFNNTFEKSSEVDFTKSNFNLINEEED